jgi:hypothetical protein
MSGIPSFVERGFPPNRKRTERVGAVVLVLAIVFSLAASRGLLAEQPASAVADLPLRLDTSAKWCGPLSLALSARMLGRHVSIQEVTQVCPLSTKGCSLLDIENGARALGLCAVGLSLNIEALRKVQCPVILYSAKRNHFVLACGWSKKGCLILNGPNEMAFWRAKDITEFWSGRALLVTSDRKTMERTLKDIGLSHWAIADPGSSIPLSEGPASAARLFPEDEIVLPVSEKEAPAQATLSFKNGGDASVTISRVSSSCSCLSTSLSASVVPPGGTAILRMIYRPSTDIKGSQESRQRLFVRWSRAGRQEEQTLRVTAPIRAPVVAVPQTLRFTGLGQTRDVHLFGVRPDDVRQVEAIGQDNLHVSRGVPAVLAEGQRRSSFAVELTGPVKRNETRAVIRFIVENLGKPEILEVPVEVGDFSNQPQTTVARFGFVRQGKDASVSVRIPSLVDAAAKRGDCFTSGNLLLRIDDPADSRAWITLSPSAEQRGQRLQGEAVFQVPARHAGNATIRIPYTAYVY